MINWRKPVIYGLLYLTGSKIPKFLKIIKSISRKSSEEVESYQKIKLKKLLLHAYKYVPYYKKVLRKSGVVRESEVNLNNFHRIPILTKNIIRENFDELISTDPNYKKRKPYFNTSGGSTGEPVKFIQDKVYSDWNVANKIFYKTNASQDIGDRELRLWGSERDLLNQSFSISKYLRDWLYNRKDINAFDMTPDKMIEFSKIWNKFKPTWVEGYAQPIYEFAKHINKNNIKMFRPKGVVSSAGTLYPFMKKQDEDVYRCQILNRYGSREVGDIACSNAGLSTLHLSRWNHYVEILDDKFKPIEIGGIGNVYITTLNNFSMPLIRYDIGDIASGEGTHLNYSSLKSVEGRGMEVFRKQDGTIIPGELFIHVVGVLFNTGGIERFQIIQKSFELIEIKAIIQSRKKVERQQIEIDRVIRKVMGEKCKVTWNFVEDIPTMRNGKYLYTICKIK